MVRIESAPLPPSFADIVSRLDRLIRGEASREEASDWALQWVDARDPGDMPVPIWVALQELAGADLKELDGSYVHGTADFEAWRNALDPQR